MNGHEPESGEPTTPAGTPDATDPGAEPTQDLSPAVQRFQSCRWRKPAESGIPDHCTHRDVHPITGSTGFSADSWCADCGHYKVRRNPRKRPVIPEDRYYY
jgi:hypothetical protein